MKRDTLIITAPLPPPLHGMSLATKMLIDGLSGREITIIDTAMNKLILAHSQPSIFSPRRFYKIIYRLITHSFKMFFTPYKVHYLCVGMDYRGIIKYLPYILISIIKRKPYFIHVHNSTFGQVYDLSSESRKKVLHFIFSRAAGVITLGESLKDMYRVVVDDSRIFVAKNCVDDNYFASEELIENKLTRVNKERKILYLSNLMEDKGIFKLMEAVQMMDNCELHIAGAIEQKESTIVRVKEYLERNTGKFFYHGVVTGDLKRRLFNECDVFALPSLNEGQPISILEAYANGMAVVTNEDCGGIKDIFHDRVNGYSCVATDHGSIRVALECCFEDLRKFQRPNYESAKIYYRQAVFLDRMDQILSVHNSSLKK